MRLLGQLSWVCALLADRDLIVPKSVSSTNFRECGWAAWRALRRGENEPAAELFGARCGAGRTRAGG
jgi:hypothetical protein